VKDDVKYVYRHGRRIEVETHDFGISNRRTRKKDFVMVTRAQIELLCTARHPATVKVFLHLQFLIFRSFTKSVRLPNTALAKAGIGRKGKRAALAELEELGLIRVARYQYRAPEIRIVDLPEGGK
jgi:hypothetical protein